MSGAAQIDGRRIVWKVDFIGLSYRCIRTDWDEGDTAYNVQMKKGSSGWNNTGRLGAEPGEMLMSLLEVIAPIVKGLKL